MVVYADLWFLVNAAADFFLLWAAGVWTGERVQPWRCLAGAAAGAVYSLAPVWPAAHVLFWPPLRAALPLALVWIGYGYGSGRRFLRLAGVFYLASLVAAGAGLAAALDPPADGFFGSGVHWLRRHNLVPVAAIAALILGRQAFLLAVERWRTARRSVLVQIQVGPRTVRLTALVDTGNRLTDPLSGRPALVAPASRVRDLLPAGVAQRWAAGADAERLTLALAKAGWAERCRVLPYQAVGKTGGMLAGFMPDAVAVWHKGAWLPARPAVVALAPPGEQWEAEVEAICPPAILPDNVLAS